MCARNRPPPTRPYTSRLHDPVTCTSDRFGWGQGPIRVVTPIFDSWRSEVTAFGVILGLRPGHTGHHGSLSYSQVDRWRTPESPTLRAELHRKTCPVLVVPDPNQATHRLNRRRIRNRMAGMGAAQRYRLVTGWHRTCSARGRNLAREQGPHHLPHYGSRAAW